MAVEMTAVGHEHWYTEGVGTRVPSVTTILASLASEGLMEWAARTSARAVVAQAKEGLIKPADAAKAGVKAFKDYSEYHADVGTAVHHYAATGEHSKEFEIEPLYLTACQSWDMFIDDTDFTSRKHETSLIGEGAVGRYGGTVDIVAEGQRRILMDIKTSRLIYPQNAVQVAAYARMWQQTHPEAPLDEVWVLQINKYYPGFAIAVVNVESAIPVFDAAHRIWASLNERLFKV